ncbi:MAG: (deoxy)nucleoside triphosphate pyrophosphohydrolase [Marinicella sp.]
MSWPFDIIPDQYIHVAILVLQNKNGEVLLTQRKADKHLAGYWEFPGGKVESSEQAIETLIRECQEELNYTPINPCKIIDIKHTYPDARIHLHVFHEINTHINVCANEGQPMQWAHTDQLKNLKLPEANQEIVDFLLKS